MFSLAAAGSKFEGTGFEKLHMGQTHVAVLFGTGSGGGRQGLSDRCEGEAVPLRRGVVPRAGDRACNDDRLVGFGIKVIFAEDFRKPAYIWTLSILHI